MRILCTGPSCTRDHLAVAALSNGFPQAGLTPPFRRAQGEAAAAAASEGPEAGLGEEDGDDDLLGFGTELEAGLAGGGGDGAVPAGSPPATMSVVSPTPNPSLPACMSRLASCSGFLLLVQPLELPVNFAQRSDRLLTIVCWQDPRVGEISGRIEELTRTLGGTANAVMRNRIQQQIDEQQVQHRLHTTRHGASVCLRN